MFDLCSVIIALAISGVATLILAFLYWLNPLPSGRLDASDKAVLVTGCDTGFGNGIAKHLDALGCHVFAGCLKADGPDANKLREASSERLVVVQLDITKDEQVEEALKVVRDQLPDPKKGLWAVVNNAGVDAYGYLDWCPIDDMKRMFEINVYGAVRVCKAFMPLIKHGKGRIINTTSMLGRKPSTWPGRSYYMSSKYAMEGFTLGLRADVHEYGVQVCIIEPGDHNGATNITTKVMLAGMKSRAWSNMSDSVRAEYGKEFFDYYFKLIENEPPGNMSIVDILECAERAVLDKRPQDRYKAETLREKYHGFLWMILPQEILDYKFPLFVTQIKPAILSK